MRDLRSLPKAHLHLHLGPAIRIAGAPVTAGEHGRAEHPHPDLGVVGEARDDVGEGTAGGVDLGAATGCGLLHRPGGVEHQHQPPVDLGGGRRLLTGEGGRGQQGTREREQ